MTTSFSQKFSDEILKQARQTNLPTSIELEWRKNLDLTKINNPLELNADVLDQSLAECPPPSCQ